MDPQALLAIQLLTKTITDLPLAIQRVMGASAAAEEGRVSAFGRPQPVIVMGPKPLPVSGGGGGEVGDRAIESSEKRPAGILSQLLIALKDKFVAVLGPLALLNAVLGSTTSGMQQLSASFKLLATVLAPVLLPATVLLSTALVSLAEVATSALMPGMEALASVILGIGVPALVTFVDALLEAQAQLTSWAKQLGVDDKEDAVKGATDAYDAVRDQMDVFIGGPIGIYRVYERRKEEAEQKAGAGSGAEPTKAETIVGGALRDVMQSLRLSIGPKAQIGGLEGIGRSVQLAALNGDPIEKRMYDAQVKFFGMMERVVDRIGNGRAPYAPGGGDFSGDLGAGGGQGDF